MRVTIEHRETASGLLGNHKDCYVDCRVEFSEEEKAIVKERDLYGSGFSIRTSTPLPTKTAFWGTNLMRIIGRIAMIAGVILGIAGTNWGFLFFIGLGLEVWGFIRTRGENKRFEEDEQQITLKRLLANPLFTVHAFNPAAAKGYEAEIRDNLTELRDLIRNSAELRTKQTFEL